MSPLAAAKAAPANGPIAASGPEGATDALRSASLRNLLMLLAVWNLFEAAVRIPLTAGNKPGSYLRLLVSTVLTLAIPFLLERRGRTKAACWVFVVSSGGVALVSQVLSGGIRSAATILQLAVAVFCWGRPAAWRQACYSWHSIPALRGIRIWAGGCRTCSRYPRWEPWL